MRGNHYCRHKGCRVQILEWKEFCAAHEDLRRIKRRKRGEGGNRGRYA
jgi:hypothetical protein